MLDRVHIYQQSCVPSVLVAYSLHLHPRNLRSIFLCHLLSHIFWADPFDILRSLSFCYHCIGAVSDLCCRAESCYCPRWIPRMPVLGFLSKERDYSVSAW